MSQSPFDVELEVHRLYQEARNQRNSFFEKLAILDGGTIALVITAVLGPLRGTIKHRYLLAVGLTFLVVAMLALLLRNFLAAQLEFHVAAGTAMRERKYKGDSPKSLNRNIHYCGSTGLLLTAFGLVLLLIEVWLILI